MTHKFDSVIHDLAVCKNFVNVGKILAAAPAAIPFKKAYDDRSANLATENINRLLEPSQRLPSVTKCPQNPY